MDAMKKSAGYAEGQIRALLTDLKNISHQVRINAVKRFEDYISQYKPSVYDDDVDFLFTGTLDGIEGLGLLYWSGIDSEKHEGQLKRICQPAISLITWLVTFDGYSGENIFYERFAQTSIQDLLKINFTKHILNENNDANNDIFSFFTTNTRIGSSEDAMELLSIIMRDHRTIDGESEIVDVNVLLNHKIQCREMFTQWIQKHFAEDFTKAAEQITHKTEKSKNAAMEYRPMAWGEINLKFVPLQEGEDGDNDEEEELDDPIIPDPLGITDFDLRLTQELHKSGRLHQSRGKRGSLLDGLTALQKGNTKISRIHDLGNFGNDDEDDLFEDDEEKTKNSSVLPIDKSFSASLFLTLVHGNISFNQLSDGLVNLKNQVQQQSSRRENLIRDHFGLFVQSSEGLKWLKAYKKGQANLTVTRRTSFIKTEDNGEMRLKRAHLSLEKAKSEAQSTLAPILDRMKKTRKIRNADQVLKSLASTLEYPHQMRIALDKGKLEDVTVLYSRVVAVAANSNTTIIKKVKESADVLMNELKQRCIEYLMSPLLLLPELLRHAKLLLFMEGEDAYLQHLKKSFEKQISYFKQEINQIQDKFMDNAYQAFQNGNDFNQNPDKFTKFLVSNTKGGIGSILQRRTGNEVSIGINNINQKSSNSSVGRCSDDLDYHRVDLQDDENVLFEYLFDESDSIEPDRRNSNGSIRDSIDSNQYEDYVLLLCSTVRVNQVHNLIEVIEKWLPFLQSLISCINSVICEKIDNKVNNVQNSTNSYFDNYNKSLGLNDDINNNLSSGINREVVTLMRTLGFVIGSFSDMIDQMINGFKDPTLIIIEKNRRKSSTRNRDPILVETKEDIEKLVMLNHSVFTNPLNGKHSSTVVSDISGLYENIEFILLLEMDKEKVIDGSEKNSINDYDSDTSSKNKSDNSNGLIGLNNVNSIINKGLKKGRGLLSSTISGSSSSGVDTNDTNSSLTLSPAITASFQKSSSNDPKDIIKELQDQHLTSASPYFEFVSVLRNISKEGEITATKRILNRLFLYCKDVWITALNIDGGINTIDKFNNIHARNRTSSVNSNSPARNSPARNRCNSQDTIGKIQFKTPNRRQSDIGSVDFVNEIEVNRNLNILNHKNNYSISTIESSVNSLETIMISGLSKLSESLTRPDWSAKIVRESVADILISYVKSLRWSSGAHDGLDMNTSTSIIGNDTADIIDIHHKVNNRKNSNGIYNNANGKQIELLTFERYIKNGENNSNQKGAISLDLIRSCVLLRTRTAQLIWKETTIMFRIIDEALVVTLPIISTVNGTTTSSTGSKKSVMSRIFGGVKRIEDDPIDTVKKVEEPINEKKTLLSIPEISSVTNNNSSLNNLLYDRLQKSINNSLEGSEAIMKNIVYLEFYAITGYLEFIRQSLLMTILASYSIILKKELSPSISSTSPASLKSKNTNKLNLSKSLPVKNKTCIPPHISRLILMICSEKKNLSRILNNLKIEKDDYNDDENNSETDINEESDKERYRDYLFKQICSSLLSIYIELISNLNTNNFNSYCENRSSNNNNNNINKFTKNIPCNNPLTSSQAYEELCFFKVINFILLFIYYLYLF
jgi:hypothetical protein